MAIIDSARIAYARLQGARNATSAAAEGANRVASNPTSQTANASPPERNKL